MNANRIHSPGHSQDPLDPWRMFTLKLLGIQYDALGRQPSDSEQRVFLDEAISEFAQSPDHLVRFITEYRRRAAAFSRVR